MLNLPPTLHPSSLKSTRQLDFSQPIVLDMGCSLTLPKSKKQKPSGLFTPSHKKNKRQLRFTKPIVLAPSLA